MTHEPHVAMGISGVSAVVAWLISNQALLSAVVSCIGILSGALAIIWYALAIWLKIRTEIVRGRR